MIDGGRYGYGQSRDCSESVGVDDDGGRNDGDGSECGECLAALVAITQITQILPGSRCRIFLKTNQHH